MHRAFVPIDEECLRRLYVDEGLTAEKVAERLGCAAITVFRRLRRFGIQARPRGPVPRSGVGGPRQRPVWSAEMAYAVGLMATDGNLTKGRRQMTMTSTDIDLLETFRRCLGLTARISKYPNRPGKLCGRVQWHDSVLYQSLEAIGLTPAKSLTIGRLAVPDEYFVDFFRGCIDGDGSVLVYTDRYHTSKKESYVYERLYVSLVSASRPFVEWIQTSVCRLVGLSGTIAHSTKQGRRPIWRLRYAKADSIRLIGWMYYSSEVPCLARKRAKAERFLSPLGYDSERPLGRPRAGWLYNVECEV